MPTCLEKEQNTVEVRLGIFKCQIKSQILIVSPQATDTQFSFNSILMRGKKQALRQLTGLFSPKRKLTRLSDACKWHVQMCPSTLFRIRPGLAPASVKTSPETQTSGACAEMPAYHTPVIPQPPQSRSVLSKRSASPHTWPGSARAQSPKDKDYKQQNHTKQRYATDRHSVLILLPPNSQLTNSKLLRWPHSGWDADSIRHGGRHSGQGPGFQNCEGPNWKR